eukprot:COSAG06_NODE_8023_length_2285_cov_4.667223_1_plen_64_part_00
MVMNDEPQTTSRQSAGDFARSPLISLDELNDTWVMIIMIMTIMIMTIMIITHDESDATEEDRH